MTGAVAKPFSVWLVKDGEPLPIDDAPHLFRTGSLAAHLAEAGCDVTWWTSRFDHGRKRHRVVSSSVVSLAPNYRLHLLDGPAYQRNLSLNRIRNYRACAVAFAEAAKMLQPPDIILASYPSPEMCDAARRIARLLGVPFVADMRDPWPDHVAAFFPAIVQPLLWPAIFYYRSRLRTIVDDADGLVAMSRAMLEWAVSYRSSQVSRNDRVIRIGGSVPATPRNIQMPERFNERVPLQCTFLSSGGNSSDAATVVEAARILDSRGERRVRITITGVKPSDPLRSTPKPHWVTFTGWLTHSEIEPLLAGSHVGIVQMCGDVMRYWLGNKLFNYMTASLAIINNIAGEPADIVRTCGLGVTIPAKSPEALAEAMSAFADDPVRLHACMRNSQDALVSQFDRERLNDEFVEYLRALAGRD